MRLYLSSYHLGNSPDELVKLVGHKRHAGIIMNSLDWGEDEYRRNRTEREHNDLRDLGFTTEELDLRRFFDDKESLRSELTRFGLIWIRGGNVFLLKRAMEQSGFDVAIKELLREDALVYGGFSAGSVAAGPTLKGIELVDDPNLLAEGYEPTVPWDGLGLIDYSIAPHYKSDHPESEAINKVVDYFEEHNMPYKTLRDGQAIVIDGEREEIVNGENIGSDKEKRS